MNNEKLVLHINAHKWWRTTLPDAKMVNSRGLFYASSYKDAEFYGRPIDIPFTINVKRILFGDEVHIMQTLGLPLHNQDIRIKKRFALDAKMKRLAIVKGYDSIALFTTKGYQIYMKTGTMRWSTKTGQVVKIEFCS